MINNLMICFFYAKILEFKIFHYLNLLSDVMMRSHGGDSGDSDSRHACIIAVFLLVRLLYLHIHLLNYLFKFIQIFTMFMNLINFIAVSSSITCYSLNSSLKLTFSH